MSFCKLSTEIIATKHTMVDNRFITDFLPSAPDMAVKVYLYGLFQCHAMMISENTLEHFSSLFGISQEDILSIYLYWQDMGLVQVLATEPFEVRYLPVKTASHSTKKWSENKFSSFNAQMQEVLAGRMITPNEYNEYYILIESLRIEPEALVAIARYCTQLKGETVGYSYITTVARIWAAEGVKTHENVQRKLENVQQISASASKILEALGSKRTANVEEQNQYIKWTEQFGFAHETLLQIAKMLKKQKKASFEKMNFALQQYYEAKLYSILEIEEYENKREEMVGVAKNINKALGVWYDSLEAEISEFISKWLGLGFQPETLVAIANHCFKKSIRTLEGMNNIVIKFHKLGVISLTSLIEYIETIAEEDKLIKHLLEQMGLNREVNQWDRSLYKCWKQDWKFSEDIIHYAASLSVAKTQPMQYANKVLSQWLEKKVTTLEDAKKQSELPFFASASPRASVSKLKPRDYSAAEINALFDNLDEIEI